MVIILMAIGGYYITGYWCLLYYWLLVAIILLVIGDYYINAYWWLLY